MTQQQTSNHQAASAPRPLSMAAQPLANNTVVHTTGEGLLCGEVQIDCAGFALPAYRAVPVGAANAPVVLVVPEIFGLHAHIADVARRLAHRGYLAIAPDVMARQGDASAFADMATLMAQVVSQVPDAQVLQDLDTVVDWAGAQGGDLDRLGITGFCWGGRMTWLYAAHQKRVKAGVAWYGRLAGNTTALTPRHPVNAAADLLAPVLGLYGALDTGIPLDTVAAMQAALAGGSMPARASRIEVYADAPHAFFADYRPGYRHAAAQAAWGEMLAWFAAKGVAQPSEIQKDGV